MTNSLQPLTIYDPLTPLTPVVDPIDGKTKQAHAAFPGNKIPAGRIDPVATNILSYLERPETECESRSGLCSLDQQLSEFANGTSISGGMERSRSTTARATRTCSRFATVIRAARSLPTGAWAFRNSDPANGNGQGYAPAAQTYAAQWTHIFNPNLLAECWRQCNELRQQSARRFDRWRIT